MSIISEVKRMQKEKERLEARKRLYSRVALAERFGCSISTINRIAKGGPRSRTITIEQYRELKDCLALAKRLQEEISAYSIENVAKQLNISKAMVFYYRWRGEQHERRRA